VVSLARWLGLGIPEYEAKRYAGQIKEGGILLSVHCDHGDWVNRGKDILKATGAQDVAGGLEGDVDPDLDPERRNQRSLRRS
jgi:hypothetical protein